MVTVAMIVSTVDWRAGAVFCAMLLAWGFPSTTRSTPNPSVTQTRTQHSGSTSGKSGVTCTKFGRRCVNGYTCKEKHCRCPRDFKGNAEIECVRKENLLCVLSADPHLLSFGGAKADVDLPCSYRLTRYVTDHRTAATPLSYCSVEVYATNELHRGRYYVRGVHISLGITDNGQQVHEQFEVLKFAVNELDVYQFQTGVNKTRALWGYSRHKAIDGVEILPTFDETDNFAILYVPECASQVKFRAYVPNKHRQILLPGISVMAPGDATFVFGYGDYPHSLCGTPKDTRKLYENRAKEMGLNSKHLAIIHDVLLQNAPQGHNPSKEDCEAAMQAYRLSIDPIGDLNTCGPLLVTARTRRCLNKNGVAPIAVFTACIKYRNFGDVGACGYFINARKLCPVGWEGPRITQC